MEETFLFYMLAKFMFSVERLLIFSYFKIINYWSNTIYLWLPSWSL